MPHDLYRVTLTCKACDEEFDAEWNFGDDVTCPHCGARWETDWDTDSEDNIAGPWLTKRVLPIGDMPPWCADDCA